VLEEAGEVWLAAEHGADEELACSALGTTVLPGVGHNILLVC
jgi:hypothetical protein